MKFFLHSLIIVMSTTAYAIPNLECTLKYEVTPKTCSTSPLCEVETKQSVNLYLEKTYEGNKYYQSTAVGDTDLKYAKVSFYKKENFYGMKSDSIALQIWNKKERTGVTSGDVPVIDLNTVVPNLNITVDQPDTLEFFRLECKLAAEEESFAEVP